MVPRLPAGEGGDTGEPRSAPHPSEALDRIRSAEGTSDEWNAFISVADSSPPPPSGREGPLAGVPVGVKDNLATTDFPTTCGSRILEGYVPPYDATVVRRLRAAGAFVAGKTNMDEFAMGAGTETSAFGPTHHPTAPGRVPGGSSGGSATAVAAGLVPMALGSDTGGSVRQPASFCGIVGIKPTYGRVSRYGLVAYASSLDQVGALGRRVGDAAALLEAVQGHDPLDATSARVDPSDLGAAASRGREGDLEGLVVGVPREYVPEGLDPQVKAACQRAMGLLEAAGAEVREVSLAHTELAVPTYYVLAPAEASSNLARFDGVRYGHRAPGARSAQDVYTRSRTEGFGSEVVRRILLGTFVLSSGYHDAYYGRAQTARRCIQEDFQRVFRSGVHLLLTPTHPSVAFPQGERPSDPYERYLQDAFTVPANLAGLPALSLPVAEARVDGATHPLPVGGQLMGPHWSEARLIRAAACLERLLEAEATGSAEGEAG